MQSIAQRSGAPMNFHYEEFKISSKTIVAVIWMLQNISQEAVKPCLRMYEINIWIFSNLKTSLHTIKGSKLVESLACWCSINCWQRSFLCFFRISEKLGLFGLRWLRCCSNILWSVQRGCPGWIVWTSEITPAPWLTGGWGGPIVIAFRTTDRDADASAWGTFSGVVTTRCSLSLATCFCFFWDKDFCKSSFTVSSGWPSFCLLFLTVIFGACDGFVHVHLICSQTLFHCLACPYRIGIPSVDLYNY